MCGIDQIVAAAIVGPASPIADDAEFLSRVYLDLTGEIPSPAAAREFLDDKSPEKRAALVDRLLAGSAYPRHMAGVFNVMLMERRADKVIPQAEWQQYLRASLASNKPYNQLAREILAADGTDSVLRPAAKFYLDRDGDPNLLTRDVGRIFFGRDFQCDSVTTIRSSTPITRPTTTGCLPASTAERCSPTRTKRFSTRRKAKAGSHLNQCSTRTQKGTHGRGCPAGHSLPSPNLPRGTNTP